MNTNRKVGSDSGFTLIEVMLTLVVAMLVLGGLFLNFLSQSSEYKFQDKRVDTTQDLEFAIRFIADDLQAALVLNTSSDLGGVDAASVAHGASVDGYSTRWLSFPVWDTVESVNLSTFRAKRCYVYYEGMIRYDRDEGGCSAATVKNAAAAILGETLNGQRGMQVTYFRIFKDDSADLGRALYANIPPPLPVKKVRDAKNNVYYMPGYTILIELEVDSTSEGALKDVLRQAVTNGKKRIWRYMQVYPAVVTEEL